MSERARAIVLRALGELFSSGGYIVAAFHKKRAPLFKGR